jgi:hypothetical protein
LPLAVTLPPANVSSLAFCPVAGVVSALLATPSVEVPLKFLLDKL